MNLGRGIVGESLAEESLALYWGILAFLTWLVFTNCYIFRDPAYCSWKNIRFWDAGRVRLFFSLWNCFMALGIVGPAWSSCMLKPTFQTVCCAICDDSSARCGGTRGASSYRRGLAAWPLSNKECWHETWWTKWHVCTQKSFQGLFGERSFKVTFFRPICHTPTKQVDCLCSSQQPGPTCLVAGGHTGQNELKVALLYDALDLRP